MPTIGQPAPDFTLPSTTGKDITLSSFRGSKNVMVAFFPLAFSGVCTREMCSFSQDYDTFTRTDTVVLPISVDSVPTLKEFKAKEKLVVDLVSDFKRDVSRAWGTLLEDKFHSNRSYFLIDKQGILRWSYIEPTTSSHRSDEELLAAIDSLGG